MTAVAEAPSGASFTNAIRVAITKPMKVDQSWAVELKAPLVASVTNGDVCFLEFWARSLESEHETGAGQITAFVQLGREPWTKCLAKRINLGKAWTKVQQPFMATLSLASGEGQCGFHLAFSKQSVEIAGVRLINYGKAKALRDLPLAPCVTYAGREPDAPWRAAAARRIETIRKADLTVRVVKADGSPVTGAVVRATMMRHAFPFGTAAGYLLEKKDADGSEYSRTLHRLFNTVVLDNTFKAGDWENPQIRSRGIRLAKRLKEEGFQQRGHLLMWGIYENTVEGVPPERKEALKTDPAALRQYLRDSADDVLGAVGSDISDWDAINHLTAYWGTKIDALAGGLDVYADFLKYLRAKYPALTLAVNESSYMDEYFRRIQYLADHGVAPDAIGFMSHFSDTATPTPDALLANLDRFAVFGKPLRATEFDFGTNDEQLQADFTRDFLTVYFSYPSVDAIVLWGFWEKAHWRPEAALFRADWSPKPAATAYEDLVLKQWRTDETRTTGADGTVKVRGFLGDYRLNVTGGGRTQESTVVLPKGGMTATVSAGQP
jgi:GH35 family endo-1,4-beta-xylanase